MRSQTASVLRRGATAYECMATKFPFFFDKEYTVIPVQRVSIFFPERGKSIIPYQEEESTSTCEVGWCACVYVPTRRVGPRQQGMSAPRHYLTPGPRPCVRPFSRSFSRSFFRTHFRPISAVSAAGSPRPLCYIVSHVSCVPRVDV